MSSRKKGFTLLELMIVMAVIAVLVLLTAVGYGYVEKNARNTKRRTDIETLEKALKAYFADHGSIPANPMADLYPAGNDQIMACVVGSTVPNTNKVCLGELLPDYITEFPHDPKENDAKDARFYKYFDYGTHGTLFTSMEIRTKTSISGQTLIANGEYGPFEYGKNCSNINGKGWWTGISTLPGEVREYCRGFFVNKIDNDETVE
ncbi:MAG: type II secretion system protein [Patescibacteria group bacterium]